MKKTIKNLISLCVFVFAINIFANASFAVEASTPSQIIFPPGMYIVPGDNVGTTFQKNGTATSISQNVIYKNKEGKEERTYFINYHIREKNFSQGANEINADELLSGQFTFAYDGKREVVFPIPRGLGQIFAGWYDNPDFNGKAIEKLPMFSYKDIDLYARFEDVTY